jgi:hypothetical protein
MNSSYPFGIVSLVWMKTHLIMITLMYFIESHTSDYVMESSFVDSILKLVRTNSKPKNPKSTSTDPQMEPFVGYSKTKLFLIDSKLEFVMTPKFPTVLSKRCFLLEFQLFGWFLPKFDGSKFVSNLVVSYFEFVMPTTKFFWLIMVFTII